MRLYLFALILGFLLDLIFGDPAWFYHPVQIIGLLISRTEPGFRKLFPKSDKGELAAGVFFGLFVVAVSTAVPFLILLVAAKIHLWLFFALCVVWDYQLLATKALKVESMKVYTALKSGDLIEARRAVSMIVGRDTQNLTEEGVAKAAVETVAENTSDGILAPMIFLALGGPVLGFFYKSINTLDSMVGYKNKKYLYFGRFSAKLDDVINFIPARVSGILMVLASFFVGLDGKNSWRIYRRDRGNHASPNSAHTEAAAAGSLNIQLAGNAYYFGKLYEKPTIGDPIRPVEFEDIFRVNRLLYGTAVLGLLLFTGCFWFILK
ncbi:MAG: cobalamin biosynthesis protein CobD [Lachnospiraceae bacterium]|jgi:adenosylcobinamide-phosphate synthase|nr:cobalamin biosynthesis protein CobD [Lachnospiraceae bacterium]